MPIEAAALHSELTGLCTALTGVKRESYADR